jgi:hypothetical protein
LKEPQLIANSSDRVDWYNVSGVRLAAGLILSPIAPAVLAIPVIRLLPQYDLARIYGPIGFWVVYFFSVEAWALIVGLAAFLLIFRRRLYVGRAGCLWSGIIGAVTHPVAFSIAVAVDFSNPDLDSGIAMVSLIALPFGALGGWILWRIVR